jgi:hypothetical protein
MDEMGWDGMEPFHSIPPCPKNEHILGSWLLATDYKLKYSEQYHVGLE